MLRCKDSPTNLKRKKKWSKNYTHVLDFAYIISKTCINEETQAFKELSICDLLEVSAPSYWTQIQPREPLLLWLSAFPCSSLHPSKMPNAGNANLTLKNPLQTIYLIQHFCEQAVQHLPSLILLQDLTAGRGDSSSGKLNCNFWLPFHTRDLNYTVFIAATTQWLMVTRGRLMRNKINLLGFILTYWSPSHQRMNIDLTLFKIKSGPYLFSLLFLIVFKNMQHTLSLAYTCKHVTEKYLNKKLSQFLQTS